MLRNWRLRHHTTTLEYNGLQGVCWQDGRLVSLQGRRNYCQYYEAVTNQVVEAEDLIIDCGPINGENASFFSPLKTEENLEINCFIRGLSLTPDFGYLYRTGYTNGHIVPRSNCSGWRFAFTVDTDPES
jgi:hypothetical protein